MAWFVAHGILREVPSGLLKFFNRGQVVPISVFGPFTAWRGLQTFVTFGGPDTRSRTHRNAGGCAQFRRGKTDSPDRCSKPGLVP